MKQKSILLAVLAFLFLLSVDARRHQIAHTLQQKILVASKSKSPLALCAKYDAELAQLEPFERARLQHQLCDYCTHISMLAFFHRNDAHDRDQWRSRTDGKACRVYSSTASQRCNEIKRLFLESESNFFNSRHALFTDVQHESAFLSIVLEGKARAICSAADIKCCQRSYLLEGDLAAGVDLPAVDAVLSSLETKSQLPALPRVPDMSIVGKEDLNFNCEIVPSPDTAKMAEEQASIQTEQAQLDASKTQAKETESSLNAMLQEIAGQEQELQVKRAQLEMKQNELKVQRERLFREQEQFDFVAASSPVPTEAPTEPPTAAPSL